MSTDHRGGRLSISQVPPEVARYILAQIRVSDAQLNTDTVTFFANQYYEERLIAPLQKTFPSALEAKSSLSPGGTPTTPFNSPEYIAAVAPDAVSPLAVTADMPAAMPIDAHLESAPDSATVGEKKQTEPPLSEILRDAPLDQAPALAAEMLPLPNQALSNPESPRDERNRDTFASIVRTSSRASVTAKTTCCVML